jgi:uncharacterized protein involved in exopolysaccharide biosynthesis
MSRAIELVFRQPRRLLAFLLLMPLVSLAVVLTLPRSYEATSTIWALHRYAIIGATGSESNLQATPAETQATALNELLQTQAFALEVAKVAHLASALPTAKTGDAQARDDALFAEVSKHVVVEAGGYNLLRVSYVNPDPGMAQRVVQAVIDTYSEQSVSFSVNEGQRLLDSYQTSLKDAQKQADAAAGAEAHYIAEHPSLSHTDLQNDPQYQLLHSNSQQTQASVQDLQTKISTIQQEITTLQGADANTLFQVVDPPSVPNKPVSRMKSLLLGVVAGLGGGILACAAYLLIMMRRDRTIYTAQDVAGVAALPVLMQLPAIAEQSREPMALLNASPARKVGVTG